MDGLIKQMRVRFSSTGQEESHSAKDRRIPPQRTQSFKTEKKRAQNWFQRQFSRSMSQDFNSENQMEHATAVAAVAYAIKSLEDSPMPDQKKTSGASDSFSTRLRSKKEDTSIQVPDPGRISKRLSGENASTSTVIPDSTLAVPAATDERKIEKIPVSVEQLKSTDRTKSRTTSYPAPSIRKTPTFSNEDLNSPLTTKSKRATERVTDPAPSMKKTPTFSKGDEPERMEPKEELPTVELTSATSTPYVPPTRRPPTPPKETRRRSSAKLKTYEMYADAWEKTEMAKIKERYEELNATILSWENKKKQKARNKLDKTEAQSELDRKRVKALQKFHSDMETIDQIAGGARAQAEEKRRNEELKTKEKANKIRETGIVPKTCFCF